MNCFAFTYILYENKYYHSLFTLFILLVIQIFLIIRYINKTNRKLAGFFQTVKAKDTSLSFSDEHSGKSFRELNNSMEELIEILRAEIIEKENRYFFINQIIEHVNIGLLSYDNSGKVEFINAAAKKILRIQSLDYLKKVKKLDQQLYELLTSLEKSDQQLIRINLNGESFQLSLKKTEFKLHKKNLHLVSIQDINMELDRIELESWQKLIKVMAHEIMSSVTPITSLSEAMIKHLPTKSQLDDPQLFDHIEDTKSGLKIIKKRGRGLIDFVDKYRSFARLPEPDKKNVEINKLLSGIVILMKEECIANNIEIRCSVIPKTLKIKVDEKLIEQVLINMVKNSISSFRTNFKNSEKKIKEKILLRAFPGPDNIKQILVTDNGPGILMENMDKIFIPFFSTKEKGTGIGLSLSKQIMNLHGGYISVRSIPDEETTFTLKF